MGVKLPGVLDDEHHERLWARRDEFVADANIPLSFIHRSCDGILGEIELKYARSYPKLIERGCWGLCYIGSFDPPVMTRMSSMAGLFLRNFIQARVVPMGTLLDDLDKIERHDVSVVLIPDFYAIASKSPAWRVSKVYSWLLDRWSKEKQTVVAVSDIDGMTKEWGLPVRQHIESYFTAVLA